MLMKCILIKNDTDTRNSQQQANECQYRHAAIFEKDHLNNHHT